MEQPTGEVAFATEIDGDVLMAAPRLRAGMAARSWEPGDDICPPWWPRRPFPWPPRRRWRFEELAPDAILVNDIYHTLTRYVSALQLGDAETRKLAQASAIDQLGGLVRRLASGAGQSAYSWEPGDDICPPWPWPWPGPWWTRIPHEGRLALDMLRTLTIYNIAAQVADAGLRASLQQAAAGQLGEQLARF